MTATADAIAPEDLLYQVEFPDMPGRDFITPARNVVIYKIWGLFAAFGALCGLGAAYAYGNLIFQVALCAFIGAVVGAFVTAALNLVGILPIIISRRKDRLKMTDASRTLTVDTRGSATLFTNWTLPPRTERFRIDDVRSVEAARLVDLDDELGRANAHNLSAFSARKGVVMRNEHDKAQRIAGEWVVYLALADGATLDFVRRPDREGAQRCVADIQETFREVARRRGQVSKIQAHEARAAHLAADDDAPL